MIHIQHAYYTSKTTHKCVIQLNCASECFKFKKVEFLGRTKLCLAIYKHRHAYDIHGLLICAIWHRCNSCPMWQNACTWNAILTNTFSKYCNSLRITTKMLNICFDPPQSKFLIEKTNVVRNRAIFNLQKPCNYWDILQGNSIVHSNKCT